ncbi:MAG: NAD(P)-dependent oxidoreductase [Chitinophagaceae bacterium]|nr:NAD(P)-dependent oxidoreductase [Chitinophagaceae bacterium]
MNGNKKRILVTGGLGNLGSWITDHFSAKENYDVTVLTKNDREVTISHSFKKYFVI